ncbi:MAG: hypothetical protein WBW31_06295, partial [Candidatus Sulfotelmatobacter sp.]
RHLLNLLKPKMRCFENLGSWVFFLVPSLPNPWDTVSRYGVSGSSERKVFSYNKRTMDRAMGPF